MSSAVATTPTIILSFAESDIDLLAAEHVYVTMKNGRTVVTKKDSELTVFSQQINFGLTQQESLMLGEGAIRVQVNWTYSDGTRASSNISAFNLTEQLLKRVVS